MSTMNVEIKNLPQIKSALRKSPALMVKNLNIAIKKSILQIARKSASNSPVKTGNLRASHFRPESFTYAPLYAKLEPSPFYAIYVHDGTKFMRARPFLKDAVESENDQIQRFFIEAVDNTLNSIAKDAG